MDASNADPMKLSPDTEAILLLCSGLTASGDPKPLTPAEYNRVAAWLNAHKKRPADLLAALGKIDAPPEADFPELERLRALLERGRLLGIALGKWADFRIWVLSRADANYPDRLRRLRGYGPPLLFGAGPIPLLEKGGLAIVGSRDVEEEALEFTRAIGECCAGQDIQVVSGAARGVDRAALVGALSAGGTVAAIPADSLVRIVTERSTREALRGGGLVLATPFDPEHAFTVGRAMYRNRLIYALANHALVVRFATEDGGTWAGAVERLKHNQTAEVPVPVFVRAANNPADGLRKLEALGALLFPDEPITGRDLRALLSQPPAGPRNLFEMAAAAEASAAPEPAPVPPPALPETSVADVPPAKTVTPPPLENGHPPSPEPASQTCYERCLPLLLAAMATRPRQTELPELAKKLGLIPKQLEQWLEQAQAEGRIVKEKQGRSMVFSTVPAALEKTPATPADS